MIQIHCGSTSLTSLSANATTSIPFWGYATPNSTARPIAVPVPCALDTYNLRVQLVTAPGGATSRTYTLYKNGSATAITVTISGSATSAEDTTHTVSCVASDYLELRGSRSGSPANTIVLASLETNTTGSDSGRGVLFSAGEPNTLATKFMPCCAGVGVWQTVNTEFNTPMAVPTPVTLEALYVHAGADPGAGGYTYQFRQNSGNTGGSVTVNTGTQDANATGFGASLAIGDLINFNVTLPAGAHNLVAVGTALLYTPTVQGESFYGGADAGSLSTTTIYDPAFGIGDSIAQGTQGLNVIVSGPTSWKIGKSIFKWQTDTGIGQSRTFTFIKNGVAQTNSATVTHGTQAQDTAHTDAVHDGDLLEWRMTTSASPVTSANGVHWGYVQQPHIYLAGSLALALTLLAATGTPSPNPDTGPSYVDCLSIWLHPAPHVWTELTGYWRTDQMITTSRGLDIAQAVLPPKTGEARWYFDNRQLSGSGTGVFDPPNPLVGRGTPIYVYYGLSGTMYPVWYGIVDKTQLAPDIGTDVLQLSALGSFNRLTGSPPRGHGPLSTALYVDLTTDEALGHILDSVQWPASMRTLDTGFVHLFLWWAEQLDAWTATLQMINVEGPLSTVYEDPQGNIVFNNKTHTVDATRSNTVQATYSDASGAALQFLRPFSYDDGQDKAVNFVSWPTDSRIIAGSSSVIWICPDTTITLAADEIRTYGITNSNPQTTPWQSGDPFNGAINPVAATDYTLVSGGFTVTPVLDRTSGEVASLTMVANSSGAVITGLQVRGYDVPLTAKTTYINTIGNPLADGVVQQPFNGPMVANVPSNYVIDTINQMVTLWANGRQIIAVTLLSLDTVASTADDYKLEQLTREIYDRVHIVEQRLGIDDDYWIVAIEHKFQVACIIETTFYCVLATVAIRMVSTGATDGTGPGTSFAEFIASDGVAPGNSLATTIAPNATNAPLFSFTSDGTDTHAATMPAGTYTARVNVATVSQPEFVSWKIEIQRVNSSGVVQETLGTSGPFLGNLGVSTYAVNAIPTSGATSDRIQMVVLVTNINGQTEAMSIWQDGNTSLDVPW